MDRLEPMDPGPVERVAASARARSAGAADMTGAQAALVFGLRNVRALASTPGDKALQAALARASGADCLNAAFHLARGVSPHVLHSSTLGKPADPTPPFTDDAYYGAIARWLGCRLMDAQGIAQMLHKPDVTDVCLTDEGAVLQYHADGERHVVVAPARGWLPHLALALCREPELAGRLTIAPADAIGIAADIGGASVHNGRIAPLHTAPGLEVADRVISRWQAALFGLLVGALALASWAAPFVAFVLSVAVVTAVLLAYTASRALALVLPAPAAPRRARLREAALPAYTVLVPLYREDEGVADLVAALAALDYPSDKLDIQFLVEADDPVTRAALLRETGALRCRICVLPEGRPRTKPRALNAGLRQARGRLLTIYDAEDRPDPDQLRVAAETFALAPPEMAAYQARLCIDHLGDNWLTKMFAIEYACQFDRLLPMVAGRGGLVLLGGTSNHFRTDALLAVGGWDPYNVTEDADLAIRLRRRGYRLGVIRSDTSEEAPLTVKAWIKQRSRWFKGYLQTWLVHHRAPRRLWREIGARDAALVNLYIVGAFTAALAHNIFLFSLLLAGLRVVPLFGGQSAWLLATLTGIACASYGVNFALGAVCVRARGGGISAWSVVWFPLYWVLMGAAALLAFHDLVTRPHHWRKTTHGVARRPSAAQAA
ncbi:MAG: hypothetical protein AcusKO_05010 [Acuticoccus sp.]